ncbi:unnamed protein product, partial [Linum tenue]
FPPDPKPRISIQPLSSNPFSDSAAISLRSLCQFVAKKLVGSEIMKFLEYTPLERINGFLHHLNLGECTIKGSLEAYSCKHAGSDKKLSLSLENEVVCSLLRIFLKTILVGVGIMKKMLDYYTDSFSPAEYLLSRSSRKTLIYLVLTLSRMYPDCDFSAMKAHQFFTEETWETFKQIFDNYMIGASKEWVEENGDTSLLEALYRALDEVVNLPECEIYSYDPDSDADPFLEKGAIWSFSFFFYNRKLKRVVTFCFCCVSNLMGIDNLSNEEDGEIFDDMDM